MKIANIIEKITKLITLNKKITIDCKIRNIFWENHDSITYTKF